MTTGFIDINNSGKLELDFYFDFSCPWSYQASIWLRDVVTLMGEDLVDLRWRFFSLAPLTNQDPNLSIWNEDGGKNVGLQALLAGAAALKVGGQAGLGKFYQELGYLHFEENLPLNLESIKVAAGKAGLNISDLISTNDPSLFEEVKLSHARGISEYGVALPSTLIFEEKYGVHFHLNPHPPIDKVLPIFMHIQMLSMVEKNVFLIERLLDQEQKAEIKEFENQ